MTEAQLQAHYDQLNADIDRNIAIKNGVAQVHIPDPPKGK